MVKSVGKWWVASDDPIVEDLQQEVADLYLEIDEQEKEISDMQRVINNQQKVINDLRERVYNDMKSFDKHLELAREMLELLRDLAKMFQQLQLEKLPTQEISPITDQPTEGTSADLIKHEAMSPKAEPADVVQSSFTS